MRLLVYLATAAALPLPGRAGQLHCVL